MKASELLQDTIDMHMMVLPYLEDRNAVRLRTLLTQATDVAGNEDENNSAVMMRKITNIPLVFKPEYEGMT
jgi:hypothetical protein